MVRFLSLFIMLLCPVVALADMAPLISNTKVLGNGKYLLVNLYPKTNSLNGNNKLNDQYPQSGLYANDGSRKPIWTMPGPTEGQIFLSADGAFLASIVYPSDCAGDGVQFYHNGKLIRAYKITELARKSSIQEACPSCIWYNDAKFDDADESLVITVRDSRTWTFDIRTGEASVAGGGVLFANGEDGATWLWLVVLAISLIALGGLFGGYLYWQRVHTARRSASY